MTVEKLNQQLSEIPKEELLAKSREIVTDMCKGGKKFTMRVPPSKHCSDMILCELIRRYEENRP